MRVWVCSELCMTTFCSAVLTWSNKCFLNGYVHYYHSILASSYGFDKSKRLTFSSTMHVLMKRLKWELCPFSGTNSYIQLYYLSTEKQSHSHAASQVKLDKFMLKDATNLKLLIYDKDAYLTSKYSGYSFARVSAQC